MHDGTLSRGDARGSSVAFPRFAVPSQPFSARRPALVASAALHCAALVAAQFLTEQLRYADEQRWRRMLLASQPVEILVPPAIFLPARAPSPPALGPPRSPDAGVRAAPQRALRAFRLPKLPMQPAHPLLLWQPPFPLDLAVREPVRLPDLFLWTAQGPLLPRPPAPRFLVPGDRTVEAPRLPEPPALEAAARPAALLLPLGTRSGEPASSDPIRLLSLPTLPTPDAGRLLAPPGNLLGRLPDEVPPGAPAPSAAPRTGPEALPPAAATSLGVRILSAETHTLEQSPPAFTEEERVVHPPDAAFDAVIIGSSPAAAFPESSGVLSGKPIYSVYVPVGQAREWILHYCLPRGGSEAVETDGPVVRIGDFAPLEPPYPRVTVRPVLKFTAGTSYVLVYGMVGIDGRFKDLRVVAGQEHDDGRPLLAALRRWEFRPARQSGHPVAVEALLVVSRD